MAWRLPLPEDSPRDSRGARRGLPETTHLPRLTPWAPEREALALWSLPQTTRPARGWPSRPTCHPLPLPLQEVVSHCKKLTKKNKEQLSDMMVLDKQKGLKSLSKEKRQKLEAYQHLFYLLQVSGGLGRGVSTIP